MFSDSDVANDFAFLVDMFSHLNKLNTKLQCNKRLISDLYHHVGGFHVKFKVREDLFEEAFVDEDFLSGMFLMKLATANRRKIAREVR